MSACDAHRECWVCVGLCCRARGLCCCCCLFVCVHHNTFWISSLHFFVFFPHFTSSYKIKNKNNFYLMLPCMLHLLMGFVTWFVQSEGQNCWLSLSCAQVEGLRFFRCCCSSHSRLCFPSRRHWLLESVWKEMWRFLKTHNLNWNSQVLENEAIQRKATSQIW